MRRGRFSPDDPSLLLIGNIPLVALRLSFLLLLFLLSSLLLLRLMFRWDRNLSASMSIFVTDFVGFVGCGGDGYYRCGRR